MKAGGRQSVIDVAIGQSGSAEGAYALAEANGIGVTDAVAGLTLAGGGAVEDEESAEWYDKHGYPACDGAHGAAQGGIGLDKIGEKEI